MSGIDLFFERPQADEGVGAYHTLDFLELSGDELLQLIGILYQDLQQVIIRSCNMMAFQHVFLPYDLLPELKYR